MNNVIEFRDNCLKRFNALGSDADIKADDNKLRMKIRESSRMMFHTMLRVFYSAVYDGKKLPPRGWIQPNQDLKQPEQVREMFQKFLDENRGRWEQSLEQNTLYGRDADAEKDSIKLELLEDVTKIFIDEYQHLSGGNNEA